MKVEAPRHQQPVPEEHDVLRVVRQIDQFVPPGHSLPTWQAFQPSKRDEEAAKQTGEPVRVSVWDTRYTLYEDAVQARRIAAHKAGRGDPGPFRGYVFTVGRVRAIGEKHRVSSVQVVYDHHNDRELKGAEGHAGVEGLCRNNGLTKQERKALLTDIAKKCCRDCTPE